MTRVILSHDTALAFWSNPLIPKEHLRKLTRKQAREVLGTSASKLDSSTFTSIRDSTLFAHLPRKLDILCANHAAHRRTDALVVHALSTELPGKVLVEVPLSEVDDISIYVSTPELCFVQMAQVLDTPELLELGFELCGSYAIAPHSKYGYVDCAAVTTPEKLSAFADCMSLVPGVKRARSVAKWILACSASPKETQLAMLLTLPRRCGGFGLYPPQMNPRVDVPEKASRVLGSSVCYPDLMWPQISTVVEYDSKERHDTWSISEHDSRKRNAYKLMDLEVLTMTYGQLSNLLALREIAESLERSLGLKRRPMSERQLKKQRELHGFLLHARRRERFTDPEFVCEGEHAS